MPAATPPTVEVTPSVPVRGPTVASYFAAFAPAPPWDDLVAWPPDVFALANLVLDHTQSYRFAVAPPAGRRWPCVDGWADLVRAAGREWAEAAGRGAPPPETVRRAWDVLTGQRDTPLAALRAGAAWDLWLALMTLHAAADEAGAALVCTGAPESAFGRAADAHLAQHGSLARLSPARIHITPKSHFAARGMTIRSFSRYLSLSYESIEVDWHRVRPPHRERPRPARRFSFVLVPWPDRVHASDFRPVQGPLDNMDRSAFGFFEFRPAARLDPEHLDAVVRAALEKVTAVDAVVLPEEAVDAGEVAGLQARLLPHPVASLVTGVRGPGAGGLGTNRMHIGLRVGDGWHDIDQAKHHRWCIDGAQVRQYHLSRALDPDRRWWEAIDLLERRVHVLDAGTGTTMSPLICEDLARLDEVAEVIRRVGPSIVIALLLDGPQLATRWPGRYAQILGDEAGSAVLTLTSMGMVRRSRPPGTGPSRVVALWADTTSGLRELSLARGASALLLTARAGLKTAWAADGRRFDDVPDLSLQRVDQLRAR